MISDPLPVTDWDGAIDLALSRFPSALDVQRDEAMGWLCVRLDWKNWAYVVNFGGELSITYHGAIRRFVEAIR